MENQQIGGEISKLNDWVRLRVQLISKCNKKQTKTKQNKPFCKIKIKSPGHYTGNICPINFMIDWYCHVDQCDCWWWLFNNFLVSNFFPIFRNVHFLFLFIFLSPCCVFLNCLIFLAFYDFMFLKNQAHPTNSIRTKQPVVEIPQKNSVREHCLLVVSTCHWLTFSIL